ncbi:hypothetical protein HF263_14405 [Rhizobium leguminosarum]|uniref:hypothetical protein n=1 Tax=Rhizobium leguminosarum TaxID=384 RepID=UPI001C925EB2|nr:hypothetical protein [Rhizobium leguminosarum]MBY2925028.1 hypothetical protein [Rhizobium leguminosarum]MBY2935646.1 hypothetical protein [Rhizobium leguminosarum]MBY2966839.1 hypothetical protein [Rhizobium leguminosarum]MBY2991072.1 hypothetical protein [Rhizobium leguminosarum]MBY3057251.1 hypothetical protein [Rhizobium leguminosarum]
MDSTRANLGTPGGTERRKVSLVMIAKNEEAFVESALCSQKEKERVVAACCLEPGAVVAELPAWLVSMPASSSVGARNFARWEEPEHAGPA